MPALDRRIVVRIAELTTNQFGESVESNTDLAVWATLVQDRLARNFGEGGAYSLADRVWRVRFNQVILDAHVAGATITVIRGTEEPDIVTGVGEPDRTDRRRFLDLLT